MWMQADRGWMPAGAREVERLRHAMGPEFHRVSKTRPPRRSPYKPVRPDHIVQIRERIQEERRNAEIARSEPGTFIEAIPRQLGPLAHPADMMLIWRSPAVNGQAMRDTVVSRHGRIVFRADEIEVLKTEIRSAYPYAEFLVLRDLHTMGGARLDRSGGIPVLRYKAWP